MNSSECELRVNQTVNKDSNIVSSNLSCEWCEIAQVIFVQIGSDNAAVKKNNQDVERFKQLSCPKITQAAG